MESLHAYDLPHAFDSSPYLIALAQLQTRNAAGQAYEFRVFVT